MAGEVTLRILGALALAFVIGGEREINGQPAGLRTHMTVALGACLFGIVSTLGFTEFDMRRDLTNVQIDVTRVASQVVVGVGFLGAGLIFRQGGHVKNLTTAASLWVTAAVGLAAGVGNIAMAAIATVALVLTLVALRPLGTLVKRRVVQTRATVRVVLARDAEPAPVVESFESDPSLAVIGHEILKQDGQAVIELSVRAVGDAELSARLSAVSLRPDVVTVVKELEE